MIYKLLHLIFGWDYVYWCNSVDQGIARVYKGADSVPYYWRYKTIKVLDIITRHDISSNRVVFLTCTKEKYGFGD